MTPAPLPAYARLLLAGFALWCVFLGLCMLAAWRSWREPGAWRTERRQDRFCGPNGLESPVARVDGGSSILSDPGEAGAVSSGVWRYGDPCDHIGTLFEHNREWSCWRCGARDVFADAAPREAA